MHGTPRLGIRLFVWSFMFHSYRIGAVAGAALLALVAAACSDSIDAGTATTAPPTSVVESTTAAPTTTSAAASEAPQGAQVVQVGDNVSVHYKGTLDSGEEFDSSRDRDPLSFMVGAGQMIPGFDAAVQGLRLGEVKTVRLVPAEAYGERNPELLVEFPIEELPDGAEVGTVLLTSTGQQVAVVEINDSVFVVDANHQLAGEHLTFEIEIVSIER